MRGSSLAIAISSISFLLTVIWGSPFIRLLRNLNIGKIIRIDVPESHMAKMNTPTMGGFMFLIPVTLLTVILNAVSLFGSRLIGSSILVPLAAMWGFALIGAVDDWEGIRGPRRGLGMRGRTKFLLQCLVALVIAYALMEVLQVPHLLWPASPEPLNLGWFYLVVAAFFIVAYANAINLTDGIDGLAGMISIVAFGGYGIIALLQGQVTSDVLFLHYRCPGWISVVQRQTCRPLHGRYRLSGSGCHPGSDRAHDRALVVPAVDCNHSDR